MCYPSSENKDADQLRSHCEADLRLCFRIGKIRFSHDATHIILLHAFNVFTASKGCNLYILFFSNFICPIRAFVEIYPSVKCKVLAALGWIGTLCMYGSILFIILKGIKIRNT